MTKKTIGDNVYDCIKHDDLVKRIGQYVDSYEMPYYHPSSQKQARAKIIRWILYHSCIKSVLRDYEVRREMPKWRTDYG